MKRNWKKLAVLALAAVVGLGCAAYPVHAQEKTGTVLRTGTDIPQADSVAKVEMDGTTTYYSTLNEAVRTVSDAKGTATITLLQDASLTGWENEIVYGDITFVGGEYTVTGDMKEVLFGGELTITSGKFDSSCELCSSADGVINVKGGIVGSLYVLTGGTANLYSGSVLRKGNGSNGVINYLPEFEVEISQVTTSSITVKSLAYQETFGTAWYSIDKSHWQDSQSFNNLHPGTTYTVYARYENIVEQTQITTISEGDSKGESTIAFRDGLTLNKIYDTEPVTIDDDKDIVRTGSTGEVSFSYEKAVNGGIWERLAGAPSAAGTYRVTAHLAEDNEYASAVSVPLEFTIAKAVPSYTVPAGLVVEQGKAISSITLPEGFAWEDGTETADTLGSQEFAAVFTPEDTDNYQTVSVKITVQVISAAPSQNQAPVITAEDKTLTADTVFDPKKDVTAADAEDGDLTDRIEVIYNTVDTSKVGIYEVTYRVTDSQGVSSEKTIKVTVTEKTVPQTPDKDGQMTNGSTSDKGAQTSVKTGDPVHPFIWSALSALSLTGILFAVLHRRRKQTWTK